MFTDILPCSVYKQIYHTRGEHVNLSCNSVILCTVEIEDTKGVIRFRKWKTDRQQKGQKAKQRSTKHTHKNKDRVTRTPLKLE